MSTDYHLIDTSAREALYIDLSGIFFVTSTTPPERARVPRWGFLRVVTPECVNAARAEWQQPDWPCHYLAQIRCAFRWLDERADAVKGGAVLLIDDSCAEDERTFSFVMEPGWIRRRDFSEYIDSDWPGDSERSE